ncbi:MAG: cytidine deaminase [Nitrospinae bacterium RIFCSPLOWO2_02_39_17]|nr:MAG: cytidine deaminase [Nitrospinae bacterium RIFCSPHIGHO2_02_39_11]OGV97970.1 MAG: cytidine deaminase [Nitrospinae bacterium RIFCSPHIGHO2_12_FULL_39_42]OGW03494.1 MAG: cytidine deaminase [Nitrospinae bacterium RIFCSPLOWO2_02_39_17]OGW09551.1 MAG: cytidine deaminase [Nitrospinae bacterium RIFCSPLOWO2_12_39_15]HLA48651.1 cytidine deaminase [Nitrospinota bacterium]
MDKLIAEAKKVRENAYTPYSNFRVGAAVLTEDNRIFTGCNIENSSYGLSICAERVAIFNAISAGYKKFIKLTVVTNTEPPASPCGACRQIIFEFGDNIEVIMVNLKGEIKIMKINELLKDGFKLNSVR